MTRVVNALRKEPVSGDTRSVVVFLHGYGANGADLLGLADPLGEHLWSVHFGGLGDLSLATDPDGNVVLDEVAFHPGTARNN